MADTKPTKTCHYCYSTIDARAVVCPQCRRDLTISKPAPVPIPQTAKSKKPKEERSLYQQLFRALSVATIGVGILCIAISALLASAGDDGPSSDGNEAVAANGNQGGVLARSTATSSATPGPTSTPAPSPTVPLAPPFTTFQQNYDTMTDAQWEAFAASVEGARVDGWEGIVDDVDKGEIMGGYTIEVRMEEDSSRSPIAIDAPEDIALSINKEQRIRFSGRIRYASNDFLLTIRIEDAQVTTID